jgi:hypothetical protein
LAVGPDRGVLSDESGMSPDLHTRIHPPRFGRQSPSERHQQGR